MPKVGGKKYPYTKKGKAAAKKAEEGQRRKATMRMFPEPSRQVGDRPGEKMGDWDKADRLREPELRERYPNTGDRPELKSIRFQDPSRVSFDNPNTKYQQKEVRIEFTQDGQTHVVVGNVQAPIADETRKEREERFRRQGKRKTVSSATLGDAGASAMRVAKRKKKKTKRKSTRVGRFYRGNG